jgi:murein DD-endopeptidase MepM/ murein hydrolase activator NlpD
VGRHRASRRHVGIALTALGSVRRAAATAFDPRRLLTPMPIATLAAVTVLGVLGAEAVHAAGGGSPNPAAAAAAAGLLSAAAPAASAPGVTATAPVRTGPADRAESDLRVSRSTRRLLTATRPPAHPAVRAPARGKSALGRPAHLGAGRTVAGTWVRPSAGPMSSCFCMRWGVLHDGIDLAGPLGSPIVAVGDGIVVEAGPAAGFGLWIVIRHANGDHSVYGHMYSLYVTVGQRVVAGQHIADIGSNGWSTGPHLHFGVMHGTLMGPYIDPVPWLRARGVDVGPYDPNG